MPWHARPAKEVLAHLGVDASAGLSEAEARARLSRIGPGRIEQTHRTPWWVVLARQFKDVLIGVLLVAALLSLAIGEVTDAVTIMVIVVLNGALGFVQEWKAERALQALQRMLALHATVIREGEVRKILAEELVPGDMVALAVGDRAPADIRLIRALDLQMDESALTGESAPVAKSVAPTAPDAPLAERSSMAWMGTSVTHGRAQGVVVATGMATEFGRIARLTQSVGSERTPLQAKLATLGKQLGVYSVLVATLTAVAGAVMGKPLTEMFLTGVSLAVAVVPEGLPAVVTISLALGVRAMVRRRALLRRLPAAETLGAATVICTDKTGTLTKNEMTVREVWWASGRAEVTGAGYDPSGEFRSGDTRIDPARVPELAALLRTGTVCNHTLVRREDDHWVQLGDPTEAALVVAARKAGRPATADVPLVAEFSFSSARKRMTVVTREGDHLTAHVKGAPEVILAASSQIQDGERARPITDEDRAAAEAAYLAMARTGLRTLALARRELAPDAPLLADQVERELTFLGVVGIIDPPRPEVPGAIAQARRAGVQVILITGDAAPTALAVAQAIGLPATRAIDGRELDGLSDDDLRARLREGDVLFARTAPQHKMRIVGLLQGLGQVVAMTGDGVNDAPALKQADIGIAMGVRGTEVAKGAADMILLDDNFATIVGAIEEGRRQYDNTQKFVRYLLSSNTGEILAVLTNILLGGPLFLLPVQILWMNLVTDGMTAVALSVEPAEHGVMERPPRASHEAILNRLGVLMIGLLGAYIAAGALWLFHAELQGRPDHLDYARTMAFTAIIALEKMNVFNFRALREPVWVIGLLSNPWLLVAWAATMGLQVLAVYAPPLQHALHTVPLAATDWAVILAVATPIWIVTETIKWLRGRRAI